MPDESTSDESPAPESPAPDAPDAPVSRYTRGELRALGVLALGAAACIAWIASPLAIGILLGALGAFTVQPIYTRLLARMPRRPNLAAAACTVGTTVGLAGSAAAFGYVLFEHGVTMAQALLRALGPTGSGRAFVGRVSRSLRPLGVRPDQLNERLRAAASQLTDRAASLATAIASTTLSALLTLFFFTLSMHFVLRHWELLARRAETVLPLHPRHTRQLLEEFRRVGRSVLLGTVATGVAQGAFAAVIYAAVGLPDAVFFGALTAVASLLPAVGTLLVWVPLGIYLFATGHPAAGVVELTAGAVVVVGVSDYVVRPWLVGGSEGAPVAVTFVALFGGAELFGLSGLIVGPILVSLAIAVLRTYELEAAPRGHVPPSNAAPREQRSVRPRNVFTE